jgi:hypothetical protein
MCDVLELVEAGGLDCWSDGQLKRALAAIEVARGRVDSCQALVLAELVRRSRAPEAMFGSKVTLREAQRRTKGNTIITFAISHGKAARLPRSSIERVQ